VPARNTGLACHRMMTHDGLGDDEEQRKTNGRMTKDKESMPSQEFG
jgi:hypothetical protein